jgi:predicted AlkP superfamily pyrophosphatase or phosphodiesterase
MNQDGRTIAARRSLFVAILIAAVLIGARVPAAPLAAAKPGHVARPKLVVLIVVDQMRADYLDKYGATFRDGFTRLMKRGAWFTHAAYPYVKTVTCAGHATVSTGDFPATHGMINNTWWDRAAGTMVTCTGDPKTSLVTYGVTATSATAAAPGESAWQMKAPSFAEQLRAQSAGSRVVTLSLKARAAISMAGHRADSVTWFGDEHWVTSTAFGASTQPDFEAYVKSHPVAADFGKELAVRENGHGTTTEADLPVGVTVTPQGLRSTISFWKDNTYREWEASSFSDVYLERLAEVEIEKLKLGTGNGTDFLAISFSALDLAGHAEGPDSSIVGAILFYLDATLGQLFDVLDHSVGKGNYVVALTGDHGVAPIPELAAKTGMDAGRADVEELKVRVTKALAPFGGGDHPIAAFTDGDLYFAPGVWEKVSGDPKALDAAIAAIRSVAGVVEVFRADQLNELAAKNPLAKAASLSEFPGRGGDLVVLTKPYWFFDRRDKSGAWGEGTTHGSPYPYDQDVPILLMGYGIRAGKYPDAVTPADIAPTLAKLTNITIAHTDGRPLTAALSTESSR